MLSSGTLVTVTISGEAKGVLTKDDLVAGVVQELGYIPLSTVATAIDAGSILYNVVSFQWLHYAYRAVLTVAVPGDTYDSADDVADAIRSAFEDVAGSTPTAVQSQIARNAPDIAAPAGGSFLPDIAGAITSDVTRVLLIVAALVVVLAVTLGWGKNIGSLARAAR